MRGRNRLFLVLLGMMQVPANAQMSVDFSSVGSSVAGITTPVILNPCTRGGCTVQHSRSDNNRGTAPPRVEAGQRVRAIYLPTDALARETLAGYVGRIAKKDPAVARQIAAQLTSHDYRKIYEGLIADSGLRANDAIDTITAYTILGWAISTNTLQGIDNAAAANVRAQVASRFSRDPRLMAAGVAARLSEELKLQYVVLQSGWQSSKKEGNMPAFSDGVAALFRAQSGQDLRSLKLTSDGFVTR